MNKFLLAFLLFTLPVAVILGQQDSTTTGLNSNVAQDDPSQFFTRVELLNELQQLQNDEFLNVTTFRSVIALGKRMTTRVDIPIMYNSAYIEGYDQTGIGDISVRLLGYKFVDAKIGALLASVEFSFNTAQSPLLGTGKNVISPVLAYSLRFPKRKTVLAFSFQQFYSLWGDETRKDISWTKFQIYYLKSWSKKIWMLVLPETYLDHNKEGISMDIEAYLYYKLTGRFAFWIKGGIGLFGDHPARYKSTAETGLRYFVLRKRNNQ